MVGLKMSSGNSTGWDILPKTCLTRIPCHTFYFWLLIKMRDCTFFKRGIQKKVGMIWKWGITPLRTLWLFDIVYALQKSTSHYDLGFFLVSLIYITNLLNKDFIYLSLNPLSANPTKWSSILKQFVGKLPTICSFWQFCGVGA